MGEHAWAGRSREKVVAKRPGRQSASVRTTLPAIWLLPCWSFRRCYGRVVVAVLFSAILIFHSIAANCWNALARTRDRWMALCTRKLATLCSAFSGTIVYRLTE